MLWIKAWHLIFMVTWFAGLFYLPRLFVYHAQCNDEVGNARFKVMERKLYYGIATPGMVLTLGFGIWMLVAYAWQVYGQMGWLHAKLALIAATVVYHFVCGRHLRAFRDDRNQLSHVYYRWFNEVPVLFLIGIVLLATVKPF